MRRTLILMFKKNPGDFLGMFSFSLTWDSMGAKISKRYSSSYKLQPKVLKLVLNVPPNCSHKTTFGIFEILKIEILTTFIHFHKHRTQWERNIENATLPTTIRSLKF